jgi:hypothetical protein
VSFVTVNITDSRLSCSLKEGVGLWRATSNFRRDKLSTGWWHGVCRGTCTQTCRYCDCDIVHWNLLLRVSTGMLCVHLSHCTNFGMCGMGRHWLPFQVPSCWSWLWTVKSELDPLVRFTTLTNYVLRALRLCTGSSASLWLMVNSLCSHSFVSIQSCLLQHSQQQT